MSKRKATLILDIKPKTSLGWGRAILEAERKIKEAKSHLQRLRAARAFFRESLERGDPWPEAFELEKAGEAPKSENGRPLEAATL
jgi:hypothetical protein